MAIETERKFLVKSDDWRHDVQSSCRLVQGYAEVSGALSTLRVRIIDQTTAVLTLKGKSNGISRSEYEYDIPLEDAAAMMNEFCGTRVVEKIRHTVPCGDLTWEVDEFINANTGLLIAEIELPTPETVFPQPEWLGEEITGDSRYGNGYLSKTPFTQWQSKEIKDEL